jgi:uncharacterized protein YdcH (DUF465 family)
MYENRIKHLEESHAALNKQIDALEKTGNFTDDHISNLKKQRLHLKDEIAILKKKQWEHDHEFLDYDNER